MAGAPRDRLDPRIERAGSGALFLLAEEYGEGSIEPGAALLSATVNDSASDGKLPVRTSAT
jgi:hypothetical protein